MRTIAVAAGAEDRQHCYGIRIAVFVHEQAVPIAEEFDEHDEGEAVHYLVLDGERPVATARLVPAGEAAKLGRIAVVAAARGAGHGDALVRRMLADARAEGYRTAVLDSQEDKVPFYARLGFEAEGEPFLDAGIVHRRMRLSLADE